MATLLASNIGGVAIDTFPSTTAVLFQQTSAPTADWTKSTTYTDHALRVVSGSAGTGGSVNYSSVWANQQFSGSVSGVTNNSTTLSTNQIPSHTHWCSAYPVDDNNRTGTQTNGQTHGVGSDAGGYSSNDPNFGAGRNILGQGGGGSHNHSISLSLSSGGTFDLRVNYVDTIIATRN
jgi:hypothetical protein